LRLLEVLGIVLHQRLHVPERLGLGREGGRREAEVKARQGTSCSVGAEGGEKGKDTNLTKLLHLIRVENTLALRAPKETGGIENVRALA